METINNDTNIIVNNDAFLSTLKHYFGDEYSLGIHGIENSDCWTQVNGKWQLNNNKIEEIKGKILEEGLNIKGNRKLLSTVRFSDLELYLSLGNYDAGGVVIALPRILKKANGEEIYLGSPIDRNDIFDRNYHITSLSDMILPEYSENGGKLCSMYILAAYEKVDDNHVRITFNRRHIYFNNDLLPDDYFELKKKQVMGIFNYYNIDTLFSDNLNELLCQLYNNLLQKKELLPIDKIIIETAKQFINEQNKKGRLH